MVGTSRVGGCTFQTGVSRGVSSAVGLKLDLAVAGISGGHIKGSILRSHLAAPSGLPIVRSSKDCAFDSGGNIVAFSGPIKIVGRGIS